MTPPCVIFEDEHLLVVNKPAGWNTHAPAPYAGEGIYDWLRHREPRWADLAIIHRLDKETSGVLVFGKTPRANKALSEQFEQRTVTKRYLLLTDRPVPTAPLTVESVMVRAGDHYVSRPAGAAGQHAVTQFQKLETDARQQTLVAAMPQTGRTHQIRVHAAASGFPIIGDTLYGGVPSQRLCLHAAELALHHPATGEQLLLTAPHDFARDACDALREALIEPDGTNCYRLVHGAGDGGRNRHWLVERLGEYLLCASEAEVAAEMQGAIQFLLKHLQLRGAYHKHLDRRVRQTNPTQASPRLVLGPPAPERFPVRENGLQFELSFSEGYSYGLFLDQRDNRRRLLTGHIAAGFPLRAPGAAFRVLNTFAYTCAFSVAAAKAGAHTTSLDLSKKYLEWGRRNFALNGLDLATHDFIYGDVFDWLRRLAKKGRHFDAVLLDPPTFSQAKESGVFRAEKDYGKLVALALPLLAPEGILFASTNCATLPPEDFLATVGDAVRQAGRRIVQQHYVPQPPDFPITRDEPAYLKTVWMRVS